MSTLIHGVAASENIDSSGEKIIIAGIDCSSFDRGEGVLNWEHKSDQPAQTVGRVISYKKIFSEKDCDTDEQKKFWHKVSCPYLYIVGELMDDYKDSAKEVAGEIKYNADNAGKFKHNTLNFSIEGAKMEKKGIEITRSIARKVTLTNMACNKAAEAELYDKKRTKKDNLDSLFKSEIEIEIYNPEDKSHLWELLNKADNSHEHAHALGIQPMKKDAPIAKTSVIPPAAPPAPPAQPNKSVGSVLGRTKSGKDVHSHAKIHDLKHYSAQDHKDAHELHMQHHLASKIPQTRLHHQGKAGLHLQAAGTHERKQARLPAAMAQRRQKIAVAQKAEKQEQMAAATKNMNKAETAGSGVGVAPGQATGGQALAPATVSTVMVNTFGNSKKRKKKIIDWLLRAEEEYQKWEKREQFQSFMAKRMPHLTKGEIDAIGQTIALKKSVEAEKSLEKMVQSSFMPKSEKDKK